MKKGWRKTIKIIGLILLSLFTIMYLLFVYFSQPISTENVRAFIQKANEGGFVKEASFRDFKYRILFAQKKIDTLKPTIIFVHGSVGSILDFKHYMADSIMQLNANMISYDRIGYGIYQTGEVIHSIGFEAELLDALIDEELLKNTLLIGYSYGGPIAMLSKRKHLGTLLLAPALFAKVEPMPWVVNMYTWKGTRWLIPAIWKAASKEKLSHRQELQNIEKSYNLVSNKVISIHGTDDRIVPLSNSELLSAVLKPDQLKIHPLPKAGHGLVWSRFKEIKHIILHQLNQEAIEF